MAVDKWNDLDRHHKLPKTIEDLIEQWRPKEIRRYEENGMTIRVFDEPFSLKGKI